MLKTMKEMLMNKRIFLCLANIGLILVAADSFAAATTGLGGVAESVHTSLSSFEKVIGTGSYVIGLAFAIGAIMKFKQHKDNPSNIPIGTPMALLVVAIALVFLPSLISLTGSTAKMSETAKEGSFGFDSSGGSGS